MRQQKTEQPTLLQAVLTPFQDFMHNATSGGIVLLFCTVVALVWANSTWAGSYFDLWDTRFTVAFGGFELSKPLLLWINDALMAIFFFVVGLEIKREVIAGELTSFRKAALPIAAAIGGMVVPAGLYLAFNMGGPGENGWGIPMATDIAFSLGVLQLLGARVPFALKVFLTAFAIVDDIGAVLVIAIFYTAKMSFNALIAAAVLLVVTIILNVLGVRRPLPYALVGAVLWLAVLKSGVHATVAGVVLAMVIPAQRKVAERQFIADANSLLKDFEKAGPMDIDPHLSDERHGVVNSLSELAEGVQSPLHRIEENLHPWVTFIILPLFALANAGVSLAGSGFSSLAHPVSLGIIVGLFAGKVVGVVLFSLVAMKAGIAAVPAGVTTRHLIGVGFLGGIGFTMSLFVANLAFTADELLVSSKIGILAGSLLSGIVGALLVRSAPLAPPAAVDPAQPIIDREEVENS